MFQILFPADILKAFNTSVGRNFRWSGCIDVYEHITAVLGQKAGGLHTAHVIVRIDTAHILVFPFNGDNGNVKISQFF